MEDENIFFTFKPSYSGFTDLLWQLTAVYKLGKYLNYKYYHTPLKSHRSSKAPKKSLLLQPSGLIDRVTRALHRRIRFPELYKNDIFTFLGINDHLKKNAATLPKRKIKYINIPLDKNLTEKQITTFDLLIEFIKDEVQKYFDQYDAVVINFSFEYSRAFIGIINDAIKPTPIELNFREAYFIRQGKYPHRNLFEDNKKKLLIHIRQGDTATIKTPWDTYISIWDQHKNRFREFKDSAKSDDNRIFSVEDFYNFISRIIPKFPNDSFTPTVFSDGFELAFLNIFRNRDRFNFSEKQLERLKDSAKDYDKNAFECFENIKGMKLCIGEKPENLKDLIYAIMHTDILVTGTQNWMIPKFISFFCNEAEMPVVILLYKRIRPKLNKYGFSEQNPKIIWVDITDFNPTGVFEKLNAIIPIN